MGTSLRVGTASAIVEALGGTIVDHFWPYGDGHAGLVADIPPISSTALVRRAREIFAVSTVEVEGAVHDSGENRPLICCAPEGTKGLESLTF